MDSVKARLPDAPDDEMRVVMSRLRSSIACVPLAPAAPGNDARISRLVVPGNDGCNAPVVPGNDGRIGRGVGSGRAACSSAVAGSNGAGDDLARGVGDAVLQAILRLLSSSPDIADAVGASLVRCGAMSHITLLLRWLHARAQQGADAPSAAAAAAADATADTRADTRAETRAETHPPGTSNEAGNARSTAHLQVPQSLTNPQSPTNVQSFSLSVSHLQRSSDTTRANELSSLPQPLPQPPRTTPPALSEPTPFARTLADVLTKLMGTLGTAASSAFCTPDVTDPLFDLSVAGWHAIAVPVLSARLYAPVEGPGERALWNHVCQRYLDLLTRSLSTPPGLALTLALLKGLQVRLQSSVYLELVARSALQLCSLQCQRGWRCAPSPGKRRFMDLTGHCVSDNAI